MKYQRKQPLNPYVFLRNLLFCLDPELAHDVTLKGLKYVMRGPIQQHFLSRFPRHPVSVMGLDFPNPIGLAAGLDQHGTYYEALSSLGFGFIEIGGVTPRAQMGNPKPRMFRLPQIHALINRKGFANKGVDYAVSQITRVPHRSILGVNIAKNFDTPLEQAVDDYVYCFKQVAPCADYVTINISSPNTPGLRTLQHPEQLAHILSALKELQHAYQQQERKYVPIVVKIAPDLDRQELHEVAQCLLTHHADGVIATNTTTARPQQHTELPHFSERGGLSGQPLHALSTVVIQSLRAQLGTQIPIIGCGGILSAQDALEKFAAGASLIQLYTGFIYQGPQLIRDIYAELSLH